jgi:regulator of PEP synthase PpsR (kinase-PPPase family)
MAHVDQSGERPVIFIVSGGAGALGKHITRIALSQFPAIKPDVIVIPQVRYADQLPDVITQVAARNGVIVHTMVDPKMRDLLIQLAQERHLVVIDTVGEPLDRLAAFLGHLPLGQPGLYHGQHEMYLERIQAIEYTVDHDDGRNPHELKKADVVLTGVSRVGKTPLSIYLSVLGWKIANVPLVLNIPPPDELFNIDRRRVIGLTIDVDVLSQHRHWRQQSLAGTAGLSYTDAEALYEELESAKRVFRRGGFAVINVTNKPIEETADQIINRISHWFEHKIKA